MTGRIFITGDKHGSFFPFFGLTETAEINSSDILIIAGDAGYVWNEDYLYKIETLHQIFPGTVAFIDGNHENHELLNSLEISTWNGGRVHRLGERVYHLLRGELYSIYGSSFFVFGGARSTDREDRREEGVNWWRDEEPSLAELEYGRRQLTDNLNEIDYVITHETPLFARASISRFKPIDDDYHIPALFDEWYEMITQGKRFKKWYFGHMHVDKLIEPKLRALHNDIVLLGDETPVKWS